ncbi:hypothetical protein V7128_17575 [Neobacillus vireti]|uniref:hypothetical protein n=1 Tax=Neobacillus vireti TaxID=220686 RepID=UPI002FFD6D43
MAFTIGRETDPRFLSRLDFCRKWIVFRSVESGGNELKLNIVRWQVVDLLFLLFGKEMIFLENFLEVLKGILRELSAYFFRKNVLENEKTTPCRRKQKVVHIYNHRPDGSSGIEKC